MIATEPTISDKLILRPYQEDGIEFLTTKHRAMITDEPGLGKTLQASEAAKTSKTITVSCPTYLMDQWFDHIHSQYPEDSISLASGQRYQRQHAINLPAKWKIINHQMLRLNNKGIPSYDVPPSETLIIDEMHHVRNRDASQSKGMLRYAKTCTSVYGLTATPIVKDPDDMFMQLRILDPQTFTSYNDFVYHYCDVWQDGYGLKISGIRNKHDWNQLLSQYVLGRTYPDVGMQLPPLIINKRRTSLTPEHRKMYDDIKNYYRCEDPDLAFDNALSVMHALRTITSQCQEKRDLTAMLAEDLNSYCLFTWYKPAAQYLADKLGATLLNGDIPPVERTQQARQSNKIVATISSLSEGVDLSHIRNAVFFEEWYTYGVMHQALSRLQRFRPDGSEEPVNVYYCHTTRTIDEGIHQVNQNRKATAHDVRSMIKKELAR